MTTSKNHASKWGSWVCYGPHTAVTVTFFRHKRRPQHQFRLVAKYTDGIVAYASQHKPTRRALYPQARKVLTELGVSADGFERAVTKLGDGWDAVERVEQLEYDPDMELQLQAYRLRVCENFRRRA